MPEAYKLSLLDGTSLRLYPSSYSPNNASRFGLACAKTRFVSLVSTHCNPWGLSSARPKGWELWA